FLRCLFAPLGWLSCLLSALYQCFSWSCPKNGSLWDFTIYLLRFVAYASTGFRDSTLQAIVDLATIAGPILSIWLGNGVSRCQVSETLNPTDTLGGRGEWLWPKGMGRKRDTAPPLPEDAPKVILYMHGGAFVLCNSVTHRTITYELCRRTNLPICVPLYQRPPHFKYPVAVDQMTDIFAQFVKYYGASNVILAGDSAGGNLCLTTAINGFKNRGLPPPGGVVLISPWCDLTSASMDSPSITANSPTDYLPPDLISRFADDYVTDASDLDNELVSPVLADAQVLREACPNTFLCFGTGEELLDQDRTLAEKMQPAEVVELVGMPHVSPLFATAVYGEGGDGEEEEEEEEDVPQPVVGLNAIINFVNTRC
ncbi:hypothetical protein TrRE_jg2890, partial [Triparma retinervis]